MEGKMKDNKNNGPKIPKKVKIGQRTFRIHQKHEANDPLLSGAFGYTMGDYDNIVLRENMSSGQKRSTLFHELLHAVSVVYTNGFAKVSEMEEDEEYDSYHRRWQHYMISLYEEHVVTMFRDNPQLVNYLINGD
jgi:Zn-dependent peptidase ImmA (M78 family)